MIRRTLQDQRSQIQERIEKRLRTKSLMAQKSDTFTEDTNMSEHEIL